MISLDGIIQAPGGPEEDTSGGFKFGGWVALYSPGKGKKLFAHGAISAAFVLIESFAAPGGVIMANYRRF